MERPVSGPTGAAEELLRLLAGAIAASRLYPPTSPLRVEAIDRFVNRVRVLSPSDGPTQYRVDRSRFIVGDVVVGEGLAPVASLAESLHALQVGQIIISPDVTTDEVRRLLEVLGADARTVRSSGGARSALLAAGVRSIAFVEVTLRASSEAGLLGLDLTGAPLDDIASELTTAAATWQQDALSGGTAADVASEAIGRLEPAARTLAMRRCAEALLHLDEATRTDLLANALTVDASGARMDSVMQIVAHMQPAALARLLRLTAAMRAQQPDALLGSLDLPPALLAELSALLKPSPRGELGPGAPEEPDARAIAHEATEATEDDVIHIGALVGAATSDNAARRALTTVITIAEMRPGPETVRALAEALPAAVQAGAFEETARAAEFLAAHADEPGLAESVQAARSVLSAPDLLRECVTRLAADPASRPGRSLLLAAGAAGAEALVSGYIEGDETVRLRLVPLVDEMAESVGPTVGRILRSGDPRLASAAVEMLGATRSRRLQPTIALALEHLDSQVRRAAIAALGADPGPESAAVLQKTLGHWDPETRRLAAREIGTSGVRQAVPALLKVVSEVSLFERNYELKKEVLKSLETLGAAEAVPVLQRLAERPIVLGRKNRELRYLARRVLETIRDADRTGRRGTEQ